MVWVWWSGRAKVALIGWRRVQVLASGGGGDVVRSVCRRGNVRRSTHRLQGHQLLIRRGCCGGVNAEAGVVMGLEVDCYVSEDTASNPRRGSDEGLTRNQSGAFTWCVPWEDNQSLLSIRGLVGGTEAGVLLVEGRWRLCCARGVDCPGEVYTDEPDHLLLPTRLPLEIPVSCFFRSDRDSHRMDRARAIPSPCWSRA